MVMKAHWNRQIDELNQMIALQATVVEESVQNAIRAVTEKNSELAVAVLDGDDIIDENEVRIEEECLKVLALYQPVASDLRFVITLLKVNTELERIGDLAVNMAKRAVHIAKVHSHEELPDFSAMFAEVSSCLKNALDAFFCRDCKKAESVIAGDDAIDKRHHNNISKIVDVIKTNPTCSDVLLDFLTVSRNLERIADSCTNIGEDIIYLEQGIIVRHQRT